MATRDYVFVTGIETSTQPTATAPSDDNDTINKGYADDTYAVLAAWGASVATQAALKSVAAADRFDGQLRIVTGTHALWEFRSGSSATDDGLTVLQPDSGTGRWHALSASGGVATNSSAGIDLEVEKLNQEKFGTFADPLSTAHHDSFYDTRYAWEAKFLEDYVSGTTATKIVVNPVYINTTSAATKDLDVTTNWTAALAGINLTTSATHKVGTASISLDKDGSNVQAYISNTTNSYGLSLNTIFFGWVNMPSVTNFSAFQLKLSGDTSFTNSKTFNITLNAAGGAIATGWNFIMQDVSGAGTATTGTGWTSSTVVLGTRFGVLTSSAGQTYTAMLFDGFCYGDSTGSFAQICDELTFYDNSARATAVIDSTSASWQGAVTLAASMASNFAAGNGAADAKGVRCVTTNGSFKAARTTGLSGTIVNTQECRIKKVFLDTVASSTFDAHIGFDSNKILRVTAVGGSSIDCNDPGDSHLQYLSADLIRVVKVRYSDGKECYKTTTTNPSLTGVSTYSGTTLTLPLSSVSGISVGDIIFKDQFTPTISVVDDGVNENFQSMTFDRIEVVNAGLQYPQPTAVFAHYELGGPQGYVNRKGVGANLTPNGTITTTRSFFNRQQGAGVFSAANNFTLTEAQTALIASDTAIGGSNGMFSWSGWVFLTATPGTTDIFASKTNASVNGWYLSVDTSAKFRAVFNTAATVSTPALTVGAWNHLAIAFDEAGAAGSNTMWVNGVATTFSATNIGAASTFAIGRLTNAAGNEAVGEYLADFIFWSNVKLLHSEVINLYNKGNHRRVGSYDSFKLRYSKTSLSGQKASLKVAIASSTDADDVYLTGLALAKR